MIATFDGVSTDLMIADRTNPWVEVDGVPVDWTERTLPPDAPNDCDSCWDSPIAGAIPAMDTNQGIQRCDECQRYSGDLNAAHELAVLVGGVARFEVEEDED